MKIKKTKKRKIKRKGKDENITVNKTLKELFIDGEDCYFLRGIADYCLEEIKKRGRLIDIEFNIINGEKEKKYYLFDGKNNEKISKIKTRMKNNKFLIKESFCGSFGGGLNILFDDGRRE